MQTMDIIYLSVFHEYSDMVYLFEGRGSIKMYLYHYNFDKEKLLEYVIKKTLS